MREAAIPRSNDGMAAVVSSNDAEELRALAERLGFGRACALSPAAFAAAYAKGTAPGPLPEGLRPTTEPATILVAKREEQ